MAIVKMSSFNLLAFDSERENLLHELQKFNYVHFLDLAKDESLREIGLKNVEVPEEIVAIDEKVSRVKNAIDILSKYTIKESGIKAMQNAPDALDFEELEGKVLNIDYNELSYQIKEITSKKDLIGQEITKLNSSISELSPWVKLNYPIKDLNTFKQVEVFLGTVPKKLKHKLESDLVVSEYTYFEILSEDKDNLNILILTSKEEGVVVKDILRSNSFSDIKGSVIGEPSVEISKYQENIMDLEKEISVYEEQLVGLSSRLPELKMAYEYLMNNKLRLISSESFMMTDSVNVINGYVPTNMSDEFTGLVNTTLNNVYYLEMAEADKDDPNAPILIKNSKFVTAFESLTKMYSLPKYNELDPTPFLALFYAFFFGMMVADLGYGLLMLIGTFVALKFFNMAEEQKNFIRFFYYLSFSTIFWGLIYGSFFAFSIPIGILNPAEQYNEILILSVIFGIVHIYFALGIKAYMKIREGQYLDAFYDVGFWYMALTGGIIFLLGSYLTLPEVAVSIAKTVMIIGMVGIVLTGGRSAKGVGGKLAGGLYNLYGISSYVGDFVSYSRLMALGLSGGFIAAAINDMAGMLFNKGIFGIIGGIAVFIVGQLFNVFLSLLGAYVHAIRLTYVEFFGKFYEGGGKVFKSLRSKPKYLNIK